MGFWQNVEAELEYQGISRKELAYKANISYAGIGLGLERDSMPGADTALRISKVLNVSIEYLLLGSQVESTLIKEKSELPAKYKKIIDDLEKIPEEVREPICQMIHRIALKE